jgi:hypothetical protein
MLDPPAMTARPSLRARWRALLALLILPAAWLLVALDVADQSSSRLMPFLVAFVLVGNVALWVDIDEAISFPRLRRLLTAGQAGALVASAMVLFEFVGGVIAGWSGVAHGDGATAASVATPGISLQAALLSPRTAVWAVVSIVLWRLLLGLHRQRAEAATQARLRREAEEAALRTRLAPHFIFNALNTLKAQIELAPSEATATADRLAALFRQVLVLADRRTVPLREELSFVEAYLGIERARLGARLRVRIEVADGLEAVEVPSLSLQVLVENAVKHGVAPREEGGEVLIWARWSGPGADRRLLVGVESPGEPGAEATPAVSGTRTGLQSLRGRLESPGDLIIGTRGDRYRAEFSCRGLAA